MLFTTLTATTGFDGANIEVMSLGHRLRKTLQPGGSYGRHLAPSNGAGHVIYISRGTLFAVPFDLGKLEPRGALMPVEQVAATPIAIF